MYSGVPGSGAAKAVCGARTTGLIASARVSESFEPRPTGAAKAVGLVLPELAGKLDGVAIRVPTPNVSVVDLVFETEKTPSAEEINAAMKAAADGPMKGVLQYNDKPLVSIDFNGNTHSSIFDAPLTKVPEPGFAKILSWYDNEMGYSTRLVDLARIVGTRRTKKAKAGKRR